MKKLIFFVLDGTLVANGSPLDKENDLRFVSIVRGRQREPAHGKLICRRGRQTPKKPRGAAENAFR